MFHDGVFSHSGVLLRSSSSFSALFEMTGKGTNIYAASTKGYFVEIKQEPLSPFGRETVIIVTAGKNSSKLQKNQVS